MEKGFGLVLMRCTSAFGISYSVKALLGSTVVYCTRRGNCDASERILTGFVRSITALISYFIFFSDMSTVLRVSIASCCHIRQIIAHGSGESIDIVQSAPAGRWILPSHI